MQRAKRLANRLHQLRFAGERLVKVQRVTIRRGVIQPAQGVGQPAFVEVKGEIGKATSHRRFTIVNFPRLQQEGITRHAMVTLATTVELLGARQRDPHQIAIMPVWILCRITVFITLHLTIFVAALNGT